MALIKEHSKYNKESNRQMCRYTCKVAGIRYNKVQLQQSLFTQIETRSNACVFGLEFMGITKAKRPNKALFRKLKAWTVPKTYYTWDAIRED